MVYYFSISKSAMIKVFYIYMSRHILLSFVNAIFIDWTFKYPPQYIEQFYTIRGYSNGQYIPLVFALLASTS
jgi:hypothetical protein